MRAYCLGGAGQICREAVYDLISSGAFEEIVVGDFNLEQAESVVADAGQTEKGKNSLHIRAEQVDVRDTEITSERLRGFDVVMDGTQISLNGLSTECIARAGVNGVNLNGFGAEDTWHKTFREAGKVCVAGFGMTPGLTQMMAMDAAAHMDRVYEIYVSHGAFRPIAFSPSIAETTRVEYDPAFPARTVYENGVFIHVPPFARPREVYLPKPYGQTTQYIIPHSETYTLAKALESKGVRLIEVRGTWPEQNMDLIRGLYGYGILSNPTVEIGGTRVGLMDVIGDYLLSCEAGRTTKRYGYALHVEVIGQKADKPVRAIYTHTHPSSDGSDPSWEGLRAYTKNVGIPLAVAALQIARGELLPDAKTGQPVCGVVSPEEAFEPTRIFTELQKRGILIHKEYIS